jgi:hypothetical protein
VLNKQFPPWKSLSSPAFVIKCHNTRLVRTCQEQSRYAHLTTRGLLVRCLPCISYCTKIRMRASESFQLQAEKMSRGYNLCTEPIRLRSFNSSPALRARFHAIPSFGIDWFCALRSPLHDKLMANVSTIRQHLGNMISLIRQGIGNKKYHRPARTYCWVSGLCLPHGRFTREFCCQFLDVGAAD